MNFERIELLAPEEWEDDDLLPHIDGILNARRNRAVFLRNGRDMTLRVSVPPTLHVQRTRCPRASLAIVAVLGGILAWHATARAWGAEWFFLGGTFALGGLWNLVRGWHGSCSGCLHALPRRATACPSCGALLGGSLAP